MPDDQAGRVEELDRYSAGTRRKPISIRLDHAESDLLDPRSVRSSASHQNSDFFMGIDTMSGRWFSVEEIAEYLGVSKDTVYAWIAKRRMPAHRIGRLWKFKTEEVDEWVRSGGAAENEGRGKE